MKSEINQQIIDDARKAWAGLSQAERTEYFDIAKENIGAKQGHQKCHPSSKAPMDD